MLMAHPEFTAKNHRSQDEMQKSGDLAFQMNPSLMKQGNVPIQEDTLKMSLNLESTQEPYFLMVQGGLIFLCSLIKLKSLLSNQD